MVLLGWSLLSYADYKRKQMEYPFGGRLETYASPLAAAVAEEEKKVPRGMLIAFFVLGLIVLAIEIIFIVCGLQMANSVATTFREKVVHYTLAVFMPIPYVGLSVILENKASLALKK
jgi:amino acid transporter